MCAFVVLGLVFPYQAKRLAWGTSPIWPVLCWVGRKTLTQSINQSVTIFHQLNLGSAAAGMILAGSWCEVYCVAKCRACHQPGITYCTSSFLCSPTESWGEILSDKCRCTLLGHHADCFQSHLVSVLTLHSADDDLLILTLVADCLSGNSVKFISEVTVCRPQ